MEQTAVLFAIKTSEIFMIILYNHHMTDHNITMKTLGWDIYDRKHKYDRENGIIVF